MGKREIQRKTFDTRNKGSLDDLAQFLDSPEVGEIVGILPITRTMEVTIDRSVINPDPVSIADEYVIVQDKAFKPYTEIEVLYRPSES